MNKPYIVLHMTTSLDGKITGNFLSSTAGEIATEEYYKCNRDYKADAFLCGRITMQTSFAGVELPDLTKYQNQKDDFCDHIAKNHPYYAISLDPHGRLNWADSEIYDEDEGYNNAHIIEILTHDIPKGYPAFLKEKGISYIFCGENSLNPLIICNKLYSLFNIKTLLLEGGGYTDTLFLQNDLIDEVNLIVAPVIENDINAIDLFAKKKEGLPLNEFSKAQVTQLKDGVLRINYKR